MHKICVKTPLYWSTKTPITSQRYIFSLYQTDIIVDKFFFYIILSFHTIRVIN